MATPSFFGPEFVVNTTTTGFQQNPSVAGLANGKFVVTWQDEADAAGVISIRTQLFNADGSKLGDETAVNGNEVTDSAQPSVTALADGRYVVAWTQIAPNDSGDGSGSSVKARIFNANGTPATDEFILNVTTQLNQGDVSISALADGGFAASWGHDSGNVDLDVRGRVFNADGTPRGSVEVFIDGSDGLEVNSTTAGLVGGGFVSVWTDSGGGGETDGNGSHIRAQRFDANGADVGDEFVVNFSVTDNQFDPTVAALANGGFAVAWTHTFDANDKDAVLRIFNANGLPLTQDVFIDGDFDTNEDSVSMVGLPDGNLFVAWRDAGGGDDGTDGSLSHIRGKVVSGRDGSDVSNEFVINTTIAFDQLKPSVTLLADGRVMVSWEDQSRKADAVSTDVRAQIIDPRTLSVNLTGTAAADDWVGTDIGDTMNGKGGADRMAGGDGNDTYFVDNAKDVVVEAAGKGADLVATSVSYVLAASAEVETLRTTSNGGTTAVDLTGNAFAQTIIGNNGDNVIKGGGGADIMQGLDGNDVYFVDNAGDIVIDSQGDENTVAITVSYALGAAAEIDEFRTTSNGGTTVINLTGNGFDQNIVGNNAANIIKGLGGDDVIQGLGGNDTLQGGDGSDDLVGGLGFDKLGGGEGKDVFEFFALTESGIGAAKADQITDFAVGDKINVGAIDAIAGGLDNAFKLDAGGAFAAGEIRQTVSGGNLVLDFNVDADATAEMSVVLIGQTGPLSAGDFIL